MLNVQMFYCVETFIVLCNLHGLFLSKKAQNYYNNNKHFHEQKWFAYKKERKMVEKQVTLHSFEK